jgi:hypothetical protein
MVASFINCAGNNQPLNLSKYIAASEKSLLNRNNQEFFPVPIVYLESVFTCALAAVKQLIALVLTSVKRLLISRSFLTFDV